MSQLNDEYRRRSAGYHDIRQQMPILYAWAHLPGARIIELGTRSGNSTCAFLAGIAHADDDGQLWSIDVAPMDVPHDWHKLAYWDSLVADDLSEEALGFAPHVADVLFIDTSHTYQHTLDELRLYLPRVRPGGVCLLHDTDTPGTGPAFPDMPRALDDFCAAENITWYNHPGWNGLGVIEV